MNEQQMREVIADMRNECIGVFPDDEVLIYAKYVSEWADRFEAALRAGGEIYTRPAEPVSETAETYARPSISEAALREVLHPDDFDHFKFAMVVDALRKLGIEVTL